MGSLSEYWLALIHNGKHEKKDRRRIGVIDTPIYFYQIILEVIIWQKML